MGTEVTKPETPETPAVPVGPWHFEEKEFTQPGKPSSETPRDADGKPILPKFKARQIEGQIPYTDAETVMVEFLTVVGNDNLKEVVDAFRDGWNRREYLRAAGAAVDEFERAARQPEIKALPWAKGLSTAEIAEKLRKMSIG